MTKPPKYGISRLFVNMIILYSKRYLCFLLLGRIWEY